MELVKIEKLLEKYENAETTLQEERLLKDYFLSDHVAPHLEQYQMMFTYFQLSKDETYTKTIELKNKKRNYTWLSVAASIALFFSVYIAHGQYEQYKLEKQFAQVEGALKLLSKNLKKGDEAVKNLYVYENSVNKVLNPSK